MSLSKEWLVTAIILDGKALAREIQAELTVAVAEFIEQYGEVPRLDVVLVGGDPASQVYVRNKQAACERTDIESHLHRLSEDANEDELLALIERLNDEPTVHGILVQLPLPQQIDTNRVLLSVRPEKDVDAFHPENVGRIVQGRPRFLPCTPHGVQQLLMRSGVRIPGAHVVVLGRSDIVGKPMANMLVQRGPYADATVTICHSRTKNLPEITRQADILIVAIGQPKFVTAAMVKPGAVVVDVGINRTDDELCGDVDFEAVKAVAGMITPVPGGVGPLTVSMLLHNTLAAARERAKSL